MAKILNPKFSAGPVNAGEERLLKFLEVNLPDEYFIVPNAEFANTNPRGGVQYLEYDCIVVAPHAVYNIENKDWNGHLEGNDHVWYLNDSERANPLKTLSFKTRVLASKLKEKKIEWRAAWITSIITLSNPRQNKFGLDRESDCYRATYTLGEELIEYITTPPMVGKTANAISDIYRDIAHFLSGANLNRTPKEKTEVIGLKIEEILDKGEDYTEYLCVPALFPDRRYKVREYILDTAGKSLLEQETHRKQVQNAYMAQMQMPLSPYIVKAECSMSEDGLRFYEKSEYLDENKLSSEQNRKTFTQLEAIKIVLDIASALKVAHEYRIFHRDVCPNNIYLLSDNAALSGFGRSWFTKHIDLNFTMGALSPDMANPYQPVELFNNDASPATDIYSLGVIFYELIVGNVPFANYTDLARMGGALPESLMPSKVNNSLPQWMDELCRHTICDDDTARWSDVEELMKFILDQAFGQVVEIPAPSSVKTRLKDLQPTDLVTTELVLYETLGEGGFSRVFKAKHLLQNKFYALKIFSDDLNQKSVIDEYNALSKLSHPNIVKFVFNGSTNGNMFYTLMELLNGENLNNYTRGDLRLPLPEIHKMAKEILSAMVYLQSSQPPVYHRDIKPSNIVWDNRQRFVLIDFNIAANAGDDKDVIGTYPYLAPDLMQGSNRMNWDASADTFAFGITLYQLLTHTYPWAGSQIPILDKQPTPINTLNKQISDPFAQWIMKAIGTRRSERFATAAEMQVALFAINERGLYRTDQVTILDMKGEAQSIVDYINSLYSQSSHGNAGTRAGWKQSALDKVTYTQTKLDKELLSAIEAGKYKLVIITGNAGDGKTAFIRQVEGIAQNVEKLNNRNGAKFTIKDVPFQSNYDGSQDEEERANDAVLTDFFQPFEGITDYSQAKEGRVIAINEGRLVDFLQTSDKHTGLATIIDEYFYKGGCTKLPEGVMIINLNLRSVTARDENGDSLLRSQVKKLTDPSLWGKCNACPIADRCFIKYNVDTFSDSAVGDEVTNRLEWLIRTIVYKRELHITMRDLRSFIAYMLTRDQSCDDVIHLIQFFDAKEISQEDYWQFYYFNISASNEILTSDDRLIKLIRETDIANVSIPSTDRDLYFKNKQAEDYLVFEDRKESLLAIFNQQNTEDPKLRHQSFIRHHYFEGEQDFMKRLPYQSLHSFYEALNQESDMVVIKQIIAKAISCSEGCWNESLSTNYLLLSSSQVNDPLSNSYRRFPLSDFELMINKNDNLVQYIEHENDSLVFRSKEDKYIQLTISLDLYEMLYYIERGFNPSINDLRGKFVELQVFKNLLQSKTYTEVLVTKNNRKFYAIKLDPVSKNIKIQPLKTESI
jgi:serine/threonine protein kinase